MDAYPAARQQRHSGKRLTRRPFGQPQRLAGLQLISGRGDLAVKSSHAAAALYDQVDRPRTRKGQLESATAWTDYGDMLGQIGVSSTSDYAQAMEAYRRAEQLTAFGSESPVEPKRLRALAIVNIKIADLLREREPEQAKAR